MLFKADATPENDHVLALFIFRVNQIIVDNFGYAQLSLTSLYF